MSLFLLAFTTACFAILAWFRPRIALAVTLVAIPGYALTRLAVIGVPFTFPEVAVYMLVCVVGLRWIVGLFLTGHLGRATCPAEALFAPRMFCLFREARHWWRAKWARNEVGSPSLVASEVGAERSGKPVIGGERSRSGGSVVPEHFPTSILEGGRGGVGSGMAFVRDPWSVLPLLWLLIGVLAAWHAPESARAWGIAKAYFLAPVLLFFVMRSLRVTTQQFLVPFAASAGVVAAIGVWQHWSGVGIPYPWFDPLVRRVTSVFGYPNAVGLFLAPLVPIFLGAAWQQHSSSRGIHGACPPEARCGRRGEGSHTSEPARSSAHSLGSFGWTSASLKMTLCRFGLPIAFSATTLLSLLAIIFARSTGALVGLCVAAVACPVFVMRRRWIAAHARGVALAMVVGWVALSLVLTAWLPYIHDLERIRNPIVRKLAFGAWSGSVRLEQYRETWQLLREHPIRGVGLSAYQRAVVPYHRNPKVEIFLYPHNLLLAVWSELGLPGVLVLLAMVYQFFRDLLPPLAHRRGGKGGWLPFGIALAMLVLLVHGLVDVPYFKNDLAMVFWVLLAMGSRARELKDADSCATVMATERCPSG